MRWTHICGNEHAVLILLWFITIDRPNHFSYIVGYGSDQNLEVSLAHSLLKCMVPCLCDERSWFLCQIMQIYAWWMTHFQNNKDESVFFSFIRIVELSRWLIHWSLIHVGLIHFAKTSEIDVVFSTKSKADIIIDGASTESRICGIEKGGGVWILKQMILQ